VIPQKTQRSLLRARDLYALVTRDCGFGLLLNSESPSYIGESLPHHRTDTTDRHTEFDPSRGFSTVFAFRVRTAFEIPSHLKKDLPWQTDDRKADFSIAQEEVLTCIFRGISVRAFWRRSGLAIFIWKRRSKAFRSFRSLAVFSTFLLPRMEADQKSLWIIVVAEHAIFIVVCRGKRSLANPIPLDIHT